jgi:hypothetical protein
VSKVLIQSWQQDDKNCAVQLGSQTYIAMRHACAQFQLSNAFKCKMAAGSYLNFDNDHNVSRIYGNPTLNKMTPVWR